MAARFRSIGEEVERVGMGADGEHEAGPECVRRTEQIAEIERLGNTLRADAEIAARPPFVALMLAHPMILQGSFAEATAIARLAPQAQAELIIPRLRLDHG